MRTNAYLRVGNLPEPPQPPPDATQATEQGYTPTKPLSMLSPSCATQMDLPQRVVDVFHNTSGPIGQVLVIGRSNPGVKFSYPYPYPRKPLPFLMGRGFEGVGVRVLKGIKGMKTLEGMSEGIDLDAINLH